MDVKRVDKELLAQAKERYMNYESGASIANDLGINRLTLQNYITKDWKVEREVTKSEMFADLAKSKRSAFAKITESALTILAKSLEHMAKSSEAPTTKEARDVAAIMESLDKITRLDENRPTEIISNDSTITVVELKEKLRSDPFLEMDEADYTVQE